MTKFLIIFHGGSPPASKAEGDKVMAAWGAWIGGLGKALVDPGNPTGAGKILSAGGKVSDSGGANAATGYSILEAASLDAAIAAAKGSPHLASGGTVEIAEITPVM
jgi:hypothetical protein